ncbi:MAG: indole-3-glycerol phosphate synthase TrpC [Armatimonadota bacterium]|nr:indole-3-glycerol phosphate synthase TrpC [Armatimonadota bacterium]
MILDDIVAVTRRRVERDKEDETLLQLERRLPEEPPQPFAAALRHPDRMGLIAEIKKASPSKGVIAPDFDHRRIAALYRDSGADCLSVLTEPEFFQGHLNHLYEARAISGKPCLRKDFIIDQYQIAQARLYGADCILLIAAILTDWQIRAFKSAARQYGMDALVEIHDEIEAKRAVANGCTFIGINNRDLRTFRVDLTTTEKLRPLLPDDAIIVAESGVFARDDARQLRAAGADAILVGESLMRAGDPAAAMEELLSA